jgi:hypothetical protein
MTKIALLDEPLIVGVVPIAGRIVSVFVALLPG